MNIFQEVSFASLKMSLLINKVIITPHKTYIFFACTVFAISSSLFQPVFLSDRGHVAEFELHLHISTTDVISISKQVQVCSGFSSTTVSKCSLMRYIYQQRLFSQVSRAILKTNVNAFLLFVMKRTSQKRFG